jgi:hypothetical protein
MVNTKDKLLPHLENTKGLWILGKCDRKAPITGGVCGTDYMVFQPTNNSGEGRIIYITKTLYQELAKDCLMHVRTISPININELTRQLSVPSKDTGI